MDLSFDEKKAQLAEIDEEIVLYDGYEDALIGYAEHFCSDGQKTVAAYDAEKCIEILMKRDGMSREEAMDFFSFNTLGCYPGRPGSGLLDVVYKIYLKHKSHVFRSL